MVGSTKQRWQNDESPGQAVGCDGSEKLPQALLRTGCGLAGWSDKVSKHHETLGQTATRCCCASAASIRDWWRQPGFSARPVSAVPPPSPTLTGTNSPPQAAVCSCGRHSSPEQPKQRTHTDDALIAATTFRDALPTPVSANAVTAEHPMSLLGAAMLWSGWTTDLAALRTRRRCRTHWRPGAKGRRRATRRRRSARRRHGADKTVRHSRLDVPSRI